MTEQERAAALADKISECGIIEVSTEMERIVIRALRLFAATPAAAPLPPIEREGSREYIPLPGGWEIQTKGDGSSYRLCDTKTGKRLNILGGDGPTAQDFVTRMAKEVHAASLIAEAPAVADPDPTFWHQGYPPKPFSEEWFIAELTRGDRVVLRALPEEYSYDFKTADETYVKKKSIKSWAQFPDSEYIPYAAPVVPQDTPSASSEVRERVDRASKNHALIRTSPKGEMFLGTCTLCGTPNLPVRAALEPCPNQLGLSQDEALIDVLAATTDDPDQEYDDRDMAEVGRALIAAIETYASTDNPDDPLFRWHPAQCPTEIVGDLIEMVNQARATAVLRTPASDGDREILWRVEKAMIAADRDPEKEVNYAGLARAALSAIRPGDRLPAGVVVPEEPTEAMRLAFHAQPGNWFDKMRAALAVAAAGGVPPVGFVRHEKRGSVYAVLGEATAQVSKPTHAVFTDRAHRLFRDHDRLVVYVGADGRLWVRFPDEMEDGRFAPAEPGDMPKVDDQAPAAASLIGAARSVIAANRSYLETNPFAATNPDALTEAIARLEREVSAAGERDAR